MNEWTGLEARALRLALRMSVRAFAEHLGVAVNTVSKWEKLLSSTTPRPDTQAILDTALTRADTVAQARFETSVSKLGGSGSRAADRYSSLAGPRAWQYESWADDLDRVVVALSRQSFAFADSLLSRWLSRFSPHQLDDKGAYLFARSTALRGDLQRDQGFLVGPLAAAHAYDSARTIFSQLEIPRRVAQIDLSLAVVAEMSGKLETAASRYESLTMDERLSPRDRARARLWVGTALSKNSNHEAATPFMQIATRAFEDLAEPEDWSVAHQKLALAHRGAGDLNTAHRYIDIARTSGISDSPMQRVRLDTAYGHILLTDTATRDDGLLVLEQAARTAATYGLVHQLRSIESITASSQGPSPNGFLRR